MFSNKPVLKNHDTTVSQQRESTPARPRPTRIPATDISETDDHFVLAVSLPGVVPNRVQMTVYDNILTIHGPLSESPPNQQQWLHREYASHDFKDSFTLPNDTNSDGIEAISQFGVLQVMVPKKKLARQRQIPVSVP